MKNITTALGDNAKFYPNYMANHLASDFSFHLDNGIGRILSENCRLTEENAKLREFLESLQLDVSNEIKLEQLLNQLKGQNNDR